MSRLAVALTLCAVLGTAGGGAAGVLLNRAPEGGVREPADRAAPVTAPPAGLPAWFADGVLHDGSTEIAVELADPVVTVRRLADRHLLVTEADGGRSAWTLSADGTLVALGDLAGEPDVSPDGTTVVMAAAGLEHYRLVRARDAAVVGEVRRGPLPSSRPHGRAVWVDDSRVLTTWTQGVAFVLAAWDPGTGAVDVLDFEVSPVLGTPERYAGTVTSEGRPCLTSGVFASLPDSTWTLCGWAPAGPAPLAPGRDAVLAVRAPGVADGRPVPAAAIRMRDGRVVDRATLPPYTMRAGWAAGDRVWVVRRLADQWTIETCGFADEDCTQVAQSAGPITAGS